MVEIKGFVEVSFVDWDGKVASVIFLPRCNFRCPMCHNYKLVLSPEKFETIPLERIFSFLEERRDFIDGVAITGGEPTIHTDLPDLCRAIKNRGLLVKLDTNGYNPQMLKRLIDEKMIDFVAMDIKSALVKEKYNVVTGIDTDIAKIKESIDAIMKSGIDYEFRTTAVPTINTIQDISEIAKYIRGAKRFVLQYFRPGDSMNAEWDKIKPTTKEEMEALLQAARAFVSNTVIRGTSFAGK